MFTEKTTTTKSHHNSFTVSTKSVFQQFCEYRVSVRHSCIFATSLVSESCDTVTQTGQGLVDGGTLFKSVTCCSGTFCPLAGNMKFQTS